MNTLRFSIQPTEICMLQLLVGFRATSPKSYFSYTPSMKFFTFFEHLRNVPEEILLLISTAKSCRICQNEIW